MIEYVVYSVNNPIIVIIIKTNKTIKAINKSFISYFLEIRAPNREDAPKIALKI